jgi:hypothetical protein
MYCDDAVALADRLRDFIHFLWFPTATIWGSLCIPRILYALFKGL